MLGKLSVLLLLPLVVDAQTAARLSPVSWTLEMVQPEARPGSVAVGKLTATIKEPWHLYSPTTPAGGPIITTLVMAESPAAGKAEFYRPAPVRKFDPNFQIETETYEKEAVFYV